ncbi:flavin-dependent monooxygenase QhpG [Microcoleus sp. MON2_D5]|uniref:flavin-dependent monooxygenase QhpG n=1 Tax=Microcoleus sp. MON2_D5 TaxID=2818833 RepID=UPI002FCF8158
MTANFPIETEVCVVGGGPAGSSIARRLALLDHDVCLIEQAAFPRPHIGESLPPSIIQVFELLGARALIEAAGFLRSHRARVRWSSTDNSWQSHPGESGFQVDRGRFDQLLLEAAKEVGVRVLQPARVSRPQRQGQYQWLVPVRSGERHYTIKTRFLVDATGKHSPLSGKKQRYSAATLALYGYWKNTSFHGAESRVEAGANEWFWGAYLPNGTFNAAVFLDKQRYAQIGGDRQKFYEDILAKTTLFPDCLQGKLETPVQICDASSYFTTNPIGLDFIRVGEAALSIDPLSSQGVQVAMMSAFTGSIAVHTILTQPDSTDAAIAFYRDRQRETVVGNQKTAAQFYAEQDIYPATSFWQSRAHKPPIQNLTEWQLNTSLFNLNTRIQLSPAAKLMLAPVIQGNLIEKVKALHHPGLDRPVAYLGNVVIASFLEELVAGQTVLELMQKWSKQQSLPICWQLLQWFWSQHILVPLCP